VKPGENRIDFLSILTVKMGMRPLQTEFLMSFFAGQEIFFNQDFLPSKK
jgi:hypothetical protein